jgi:ribonuclease P/MRP protein subunit RPP1
VGYSVLAFNQCIQTKVEPKTFVNVLDPLLRQLKKRPGVVYLKRLTIVLDEDSEKGFGLVRSYFHNHLSRVADAGLGSADKRAIQFI